MTPDITPPPVPSPPKASVFPVPVFVLEMPPERVMVPVLVTLMLAVASPPKGKMKDLLLLALVVPVKFSADVWDP